MTEMEPSPFTVIFTLTVMSWTRDVIIVTPDLANVSLLPTPTAPPSERTMVAPGTASLM